ncbi:MAG: UDP-N-acetylmuramoylalanyl-D-glutamyl-2, 6-diaminopimelate--D-alanyl-D-alanine ligase [Rhodospirillaceae bacterium]|nr:UDP-N-acetylmuramoylalanyl-D-glutamyl-2, 6-diaminopimelate--D-alanyl-D-alanine ligase [Rhodospirillaceae bacterium]
MNKAAASLWSAAQAASATGGEVRGEWRADGVSIDSRTLAPGDLFVALKGPNHDGHDHVQAALSAQAAAAMVERAPDGVAAPLLIVPDTLEGLVALARAARARSDARIVAVTGSVGKTGSKDMIARALATSGPVTVSAGNLNNHIGAPLSLARLPQDAAYGVFELGMNHAREITPLSRLVRPHVVLVTNVEAVHMEFFADVSDIAEAKAEIFAGVEPGAVAVLNRDNAHFDLLQTRAREAGIARIIAFGRGEECDARLLAYATGSAGGEVEAEIAGERISYRIGLSGEHWALNSVAALAAAGAAGAPIGAAADALAGQTALSGRGARLRLGPAGGTFEVIDESYNASPVAVAAAIRNLHRAELAPDGRRIAVLGDMLELGESGPAAHAALAENLVQAEIDLVFTAGPLMAHLFDALPELLRGARAETSADLLPALRGALKAGDVVLIKGSLGMKMRPLVEALEAAAG